MNDYYLLILLCCLGLGLVMVAFLLRRSLISRANWMTSFQSVTKKYDGYLIGSAIEFVSIFGIIVLMADRSGWPETYSNYGALLFLAGGTVVAWVQTLSSLSFFHRTRGLYPRH